MTHLPSPASAKGPLPIILGVTGHRKLRPEDLAGLENLVRGIIVDIGAKHPHTPLFLFSPLAEGADRLAARVALEMGIPLIAPLPLTQDEYERDFETPGSLEEFRSLLEKASRRFELPLLKGYTAENVREPGEARNHHYAQVGAYIARHSNILIALWDGNDPNKIGGTAEVVKFKLEGIPEPYGPPPNPLDPVESGPVYHIVTPRISNPEPPNAMQLVYLYPPGYESIRNANWAHRRILARIETFNRDARLLEPGPYQPLIPREEMEKMPPTAKGIFAWFTVADRAAIFFHRFDRWAIEVLVILSISAAVFLQASTREGATVGWYAAYQLFLAWLYCLYFVIWWTDLHNKYLDYRALAEGLRVQLFWWPAGIRESVADHYLRKQRGELDWIRQAIRSRTIQMTSDVIGLQFGPLQPERMALVFQFWVKDQADYFARASRKSRRWSKAIRYVGYGACVVPVLLAVIKRFLGGGHPLLIWMGLSLAIAAGLLIYAKVQAYAEHTKHYERMRQLWERGQRKLMEYLQRGKAGEHDVQELLKELGKEALIENSDWVLLHRERPPEPKG